MQVQVPPRHLPRSLLVAEFGRVSPTVPTPGIQGSQAASSPEAFPVPIHLKTTPCAMWRAVEDVRWLSALRTGLRFVRRESSAESGSRTELHVARPLRRMLSCHTAVSEDGVSLL